ncbi:MAG: metallophosphoesterase [Pseudomonadota bacterium]
MPRLAIVTDIHHGPSMGKKRGEAAAEAMSAFAEFCTEQRPDLVLELGDRILDKDAETDMRLEREVAAMFSTITQPVLHLMGNHDRDFLSAGDNAEALSQSMAHETKALGEWTIAAWRSETPYHPIEGMDASESDLEWLEALLTSASGPLLIASHAPVAMAGLKGNPYFEHRPPASTYPRQAERIREAIREYDGPLVWISGHVHQNTISMTDGRLHLTQQSLTETTTTHGEIACAMGLLELGDNVRWRVYGRDPVEFSIPQSRLTGY